ncbi:MAG: hypothetical protein DRJ50_13605, partial [Actinobacteria bacterium]
IGDAPVALGTQTDDITAAVQAWVDDPAGNFGLIIVPSATTDGAIVRSSEYDTVSQRPKLTVEYVDAGITPLMTCSLSSLTAAAGGSVDLEVFLSSPDGDMEMNAYQTQIQITPTSGTGSVSVPCPGGVSVDDGRTDYLFFNEVNAFWASTCPQQRASANLLVGSKTLGATPAYLSEYTLAVAPGTTEGATFEISFVSSPGSRVLNGAAGELPLDFGPVCTLTVTGCNINAECDDGNLCTTDTCNAGSCEHSALDCSAFDDECNAGACNPATGSCETEPANEGAACDDLDACSLGDTCSAGVCTAGPPIDCNDANLCTFDSCTAGVCVYSPSGVCSIEGNITYYRDHDGNVSPFEPSTKGVPNVDIDDDGDLVPDATSDSGGAYLTNPGTSAVVEALGKYGAGAISDHNNSITPLDATYISWHRVNLIQLSANQFVAGDVTGDGSISSLDAARVAQFSVGLLVNDHFGVATANDSDWAFLRCDNYVDASNQDCGPPSYVHNPLTAPQVDDNFYAVLYGDVNGNWQPQAPPAPGRVDPGLDNVSGQFDPESMPWLQNQAFGESSNESALAEREALLRQMPNGELLPGIDLELVPTTTELVDGARRQTYRLVMHQGDGLQSLDLDLTFASAQVRVVDVKKGAAASDFSLSHNGGPGGQYKVSQFGVLPLQGSGTLLELTVEFRLSASQGTPFRVMALANERPITVEIKGKDTEIESARPKVIE